MTRDWSSLVRLAVAVALLASPFWLLPHAGETAFQYEADRIEYESGVGGYVRADGRIDRLPCYRVGSLDGHCLLASEVAQNGPVTVDLRSVHGYDLTEYVVVEDSGSHRAFFRWNVTRSRGDADAVPRVTYALEAVGPETVLRDIAVNRSEVSLRVRRTLDGETVTVRAEDVHAGTADGETMTVRAGTKAAHAGTDRDDVLDAAGTVVRSNGSYHLVTATGRQPPDWSEGEATAARAVAFVAGIALLVAGRDGT